MTETAPPDDPFDFGDLKVEDLDIEEPVPFEAINYTEPDEKFVKAPRRPPHARVYELKVVKALDTGMRLAIQNPDTVADAAAIIMYGPSFSSAMGDWAARDSRVRRAIDFITEGADNPAAAAVLALLPMALQVLRNHEPIVEAEPRTWKLRFRKHIISIRLRLKLGRLRNLTNDPEDFATHVFSNPAITDALNKRGIQVADIKQSRRRRRRRKEPDLA